MSEKKFEVFTGDKQLDLIRVVDHLVCGDEPNENFEIFQGPIPLQNILGLSFTLAANCTGHCYPHEATVEKMLAVDIEKLVDFSTMMGAKSLLIPIGYPELNAAFGRAITKINEERGRDAAQLASEPAVLLFDRYHYNNKSMPKSMLTEGVRGTWSVQPAPLQEIA